MYNTILLGEFLGSYCSSKGITLNETKLQKLLYIIYGTYLVMEGEPICDEEPRAWPYGPVFDSLQRDLAKRSNLEFETLKSSKYEKILTDKRTAKIFDKVLDNFGGWSSEQLCEWSRKSGSAWATTLSNSGVEYGSVIHNRDITKYFSKLIDQRERNYTRIFDTSQPPQNGRIKTPPSDSTNPDTMSLENQQLLRYGEDTLLRSKLARWMMWFIPIWMVLVLAVISICDIDSGVKIALLGTTTVNVLGLPLIILKGLFDKHS